MIYRKNQKYIYHNQYYYQLEGSKYLTFKNSEEQMPYAAFAK